jgi:transcriptional regulator with GAF, ATPase, and Fis domain/ligand-binding sensor domain-containing protein
MINSNLKFLIILFLLTSPALETFAQQYNIIHYNRSQDKIGNQVWNIYQDSKGYMWFSTSSGLARYNGWEYEVYTKENGLLESFAFSVNEDKHGNYWVGSPRGISRLSFTGTSSSSPIIENKILGKYNDFYRVYVDSYNRVWAYNTVASSDIYMIENDSLYNFSERYKFRDQKILFISENKGRVYLLTSQDKIYEFFIDVVSEVRLPAEAKKIKPRMFFFNSKNELILCGAGGAGRINLDQSFEDKKVNWITSESSMYALESKFGGYWISTEQNGLIRVKDDLLLHITEKNGLPTNYLYTLLEDREGILWIGTGIKGIFKLPNLRITSFGKAEGFVQGAISSITIHENNIYCTTENGIFLFEEPYFRRLQLETDKKTAGGTMFFFQMMHLSGDRWLLGGADGLYMLRSNSKAALIGLEGMWVQTFFRDQSGQVWVGTNNGLFRFNDNGIITKVDIGQNDVAVNALIETKLKDLYIGSTEGLIVLVNGTDKTKPAQVKKITTADGLLSNVVQDLVFDPEGEIIVGTAEGINIINKEGIDTITSGLSNREIVVLFKDSKNQIWAGTNYGLNRLEKRDGHYIVVRNYYQKDGLASNEFTRNSTITEDVQGRILIGSFAGLAIYDPSQGNEDFVKPLCYISSVYVNDSPYSMLQPVNKLKHTENKFSFNFEGLSFVDEQMVKYQYYIEPAEREWVNTTITPVASYNFLEPGDYIFKVKAISAFGVQSDIQTWAFTIAPPFWKTWWFIFLLISLVTILIFMVHNYRTRQIRNRNERLQNLVNEKTSQLRITNEKLETQYKDLLEAQNKLVEKEKLEEAFREIEKLKNRLAVENIYLREKQTVVYEVGSIIGNSESTKKIREQILEVAPTDSTVLITGETGTGKTIIAEAIHTISKRKERAGVSVNCAAIPDGLVESELFGHEKGAFTGAHTRRVGKFEVADGSTIFLDEIGDMDLHIQAKVLTFLQERKFTRLGGNDLISVDVRIIAATNYDLEKLVAEGKFRKDLYHRLQVYHISVPSLRERYEDIEPLTKFFIDRFSKIMNKTITAINKAAIEKLKNYRFPGNVRELENIIQRAIIVCKGNVITDEDITISESKYEFQDDHDKVQKIVSLAEMERNYILAVLRKTKGKIAGSNGAAELLGLHPNTLRSRMEKLKIHTNQNLP